MEKGNSKFLCLPPLFTPAGVFDNFGLASSVILSGFVMWCALGLILNKQKDRVDDVMW